jgi:putative flippase GtrA
MLNGTISLVGNVGLVAAFSAVLHLTPIVANLAAIAICSLANFALSNSLIFTTALMGSSRPTRGKTCSTPIAELEAVTK